MSFSDEIKRFTDRARFKLQHMIDIDDANAVDTLRASSVTM